MDPREIAAEVLGGDARLMHTHRIKGGLTNESWCVTSGEEAVVVRISTADEQALQLNRSSERTVLKLVEQAGIGAQVLLWAPDRRLLVTRLVAGETLTLASVRLRRNVERLAALLQRLHVVAAPSSVQRIDLSASIYGYCRTLDAQGISSSAASRLDRERALEIAAESAQQRDVRLCHNDVHHLNVVDAGERLYLLDWEYAGVGDPYFDLASVCCYHNYDAALRTCLLAAYCSAGPTDFPRLERMCWLFDYIRNLWLEVREAKRIC